MFSFIYNPRVVIAVVLIWYCVITSVFLFRNNFNLSSFINIGDKFTQAAELPSNVTVKANSYGYDGQFYYRLALNPFTTTITAFGITLDLPAVRQQRIIYPLMVWLASFGQENTVPLLLLLLNLVGLTVLGFLGMALVKDLKQPLYLVWLLLVYPGFLATLSHDLTEIMAAVWLLAAYLAFTRNRLGITTALLSLAVLTRETTLLFVVAFGAYYAWTWLRQRDQQSLRRMLCFCLPIAVFVVWQCALRVIWGQWPMLTSGGFNFTWPLKAMVYNFYHLETTVQKIKLIEIFYVLTFIGYGAVALKKSIVEFPIKIAWALYLLLFLFYSKSIWVESWSFLRASTELYLMTWLVLLPALNSKLKWGLILFGATIQVILILKLLF